MSDFESRLAQIPLRPAPPQWRGEILRAARAVNAPDIPRHPRWRELFSFPKLALGGLWIAIAILRLSTPNDPGREIFVRTAPISLEVLRNQLQIQANLMAELGQPKPPTPLPQSPHGAMIAGDRRRFV